MGVMHSCMDYLERLGNPTSPADLSHAEFFGSTAPS